MFMMCVLQYVFNFNIIKVFAKLQNAFKINALGIETKSFYDSNLLHVVQIFDHYQNSD